jgi:cytochrome P450
MPTFDDEQLLPYLRAFCKEVLRWRPVAVLGGTPHANTEPDMYQGYYIPAGTNILGNSWAINLNEEYYPDPDKFNPLRFLDVEPSSLTYLSKTYVAEHSIATGEPHPSKIGHSSFGWGRRICPGADLASNTLFIALARLVWSFNILPIKGKVYDTLDYTNGFNIRPNSFQCLIQVRSERHRQVLDAEYRRAEEVMAKFPVFKEQEIQV